MNFQLPQTIAHAACLAVALAGGVALSQDKPVGEIVLVDGERVAAQVVGVREGGLSTQAAAGELRTFADGQWLRWNHPEPPATRPRVRLFDSSCVVTRRDWTGKVPLIIDAEKVTIDNQWLGKIEVARDQLRCVLIEATKEPAALQHSLEGLANGVTDTDRVWLVSGDVLTGRVVQFDGTTLELDLAGQQVSILASQISAISFHTPDHLPPRADPNYLLGLADGSLIEAIELTLDDGNVEFTTTAGSQWSTTRQGGLVFLQSLAPSIVYLSDLEPVDYQHTPYFGGEWPLVRDQSLASLPLSASGQRYAKGIAMHSAARAVYRVPDEARRLCADVAIDDDSGVRGSAVFRVYRLTDKGLEPAYESEVVRGGQPPRSVSIDVADSAAVVLVVDYADFGDELDHADWLDARFVR